MAERIGYNETLAHLEAVNPAWRDWYAQFSQSETHMGVELHAPPPIVFALREIAAAAEQGQPQLDIEQLANLLQHQMQPDAQAFLGLLRTRPAEEQSQVRELLFQAYDSWQTASTLMSAEESYVNQLRTNPGQAATRLLHDPELLTQLDGVRDLFPSGSDYRQYADLLYTRVEQNVQAVRQAGAVVPTFTPPTITPVNFTPATQTDTGNGNTPDADERGWVERTWDDLTSGSFGQWVERQWDYFTGSGSRWFVAIPGMALGFFGSIFVANAFTGGGIFSTVIGGLAGITVAMLGGIAATDAYDYVSRWFDDEMPGNPAEVETPQPQISQVQEQGTVGQHVDATQLGNLPLPPAGQQVPVFQHGRV